MRHRPCRGKCHIFFKCFPHWLVDTVVGTTVLAQGWRVCAPQGRMLFFWLACTGDDDCSLDCTPSILSCGGPGVDVLYMGQQRQLLPACVVTLRAGVLIHAHPFCLVEAASAWLGGLESRPTLLCMRRVHLWSLDVALEWGAAVTPVCAKQQAGFLTVPPAVLDAPSFRGVPPRQCTSMLVCWCVCCATKWPAPYMRVRACCIPIEFQHAF